MLRKLVPVLVKRMMDEQSAKAEAERQSKIAEDFDKGGYGLKQQQGQAQQSSPSSPSEDGGYNSRFLARKKARSGILEAAMSGEETIRLADR